MAGTYERGQRLASDTGQVFLKGDPLVARQHGLARANDAVTITNDRGDVGNLVTVRFALAQGAAKQRKRFTEERGDEVRLQATGFGALHVLTDLLDTCGAEGFVRQGTFLDQLLQVIAVEDTIDDLGEPRFHFRTVAVADGFDE